MYGRSCVGDQTPIQTVAVWLFRPGGGSGVVLLPFATSKCQALLQRQRRRDHLVLGPSCQIIGWKTEDIERGNNGRSSTFTESWWGWFLRLVMRIRYRWPLFGFFTILRQLKIISKYFFLDSFLNTIIYHSKLVLRSKDSQPGPVSTFNMVVLILTIGCIRCRIAKSDIHFLLSLWHRQASRQGLCFENQEIVVKEKSTGLFLKRE